MTNGTMKINVTKRFDRNCTVYAFDVRIDGVVHAEVSKNKAFSLIMQAEEVARDLGMGFDVYGQHYLVAA